MYKVKLSAKEREAIQRGHVPTLKEKLEQVNEVLIKELKKQKGDVAFQQGASHIVDSLLDILNIQSVS